MKTYIFNTNFTKQEEEHDKLISKQKSYMEKCPGQIVISSNRGLYNYNDDLQYTDPHIKSLYHGLYVEDIKGQVRIDKHFPKTKALFITTMWAEKDAYVVADNGFYTHGTYFNDILKSEEQAYMKDLFGLNRIYLIYLKGDERNNVLLDSFYMVYDETHDYTIVSYGQLEPENVLNIITGYTYAYSESLYDLNLLNKVDHGFAIGEHFDIRLLAENVDHINKYYFINKYIELYI